MNCLQLLHKAITTDEYLQQKKITLKETDALLALSGGDARKLLNTLELVVNMTSGSKIEITNELVTSSVQQNLSMYDKGGEQHYDIISAFIKSIRGSDPNAAVLLVGKNGRRRRRSIFYCKKNVDFSV
jgi:putative ATPase